MSNSFHAWRIVAGVILSAAMAASTVLPARAAPVSGMSLWLDAADNATFPGIGLGGGVNTWSDKSASGLDVTKAAGPAGNGTAFRVSNQLNGLPVVRFDGTATLANVIDSPFSDVSGVHSVFIVLKATKPASTFGGIIDADSGGPGGAERREVLVYSNGIEAFRGAGGGFIDNGNYTDGDYVVYSSIWNGASSATYINGANVVTGSLSTSGFTTDKFRIADDFNDEFYTGDIAEILVYNSALNPSDRQSNEQYLVAKWLPEPSGVMLLLLATAATSIARRRRETPRFSAANANRFAMVAVVAVSLINANFASAAAYELSVASYNNSRVLHYNSGTNTVSTYSAGSSALTHPEGLTYGPDGLVYVTGFNGTGGNTIYRYDPTTNAYLDVFPAPSANLSNPIGIKFSGGKAYVTNAGNSTVNRFNANGAYDTTFATMPASVNNYYRGVFGPDGSYYQTDYTGGVRKFTSSGTEIYSTGTNPFIRAVTLSGGNSTAVDLDFGPDGNLYIERYVGKVTRVNPNTGAVLDDVLTGLTTPYAMVFTPDNKLYLSSYTASTVTSYNFNATLNVAWTGATTVISSANGLDGGAGIAFTFLPEPSSLGILFLAATSLMPRRRSV